MAKRRNISSGAIWENIVGYSRAVVMGNQIEVSGTVAVDENGKVVGPGDVYKQTEFILKKVSKILSEAGFGLEDVIRTRIYVVNISDWERIGEAHGEAFRVIKPATSMVEVSALIDPEYLIEIEVSAVRPD